MRVVDTPITEYGFAGVGVGAAFAGLEAHRRVHDLELRHAGDRPHRQLRRQDALHVGRHRCIAPSCSADRTAPPRASPRSTARTYAAWYAHVPGLKVIAPYTAADAKGLLKAAIRDPSPVDLPRERDPLRPELRGAEARRFRAADRQGARRARGRRRHHRLLSRAAWPMRSTRPSSSPRRASRPK